MSRTVKDYRLETRSARARLDARQEPYWRSLQEGAHLGYYRGTRVGKWVARYRRPGGGGNYQKQTLGEADDYADADGSVILSFRDAQDKARVCAEIRSLVLSSDFLSKFSI